MKEILVWLGLGIFFGYFWGRVTTTKIFRAVFKQFQDEMHEQYLMLLKKHNILPKKDVTKNVHKFPYNKNSKSA